MDRRLLPGRDAFLLLEIARDLLQALSHRHNDKWYCLCCTEVGYQSNFLFLVDYWFLTETMGYKKYIEK